MIFFVLISYKIKMLTHIDLLKFGESLEEEHKNCIPRYIDDDDERDIGHDASANYKKDYYMCVNILMNYKIDVINIKKNPHYYMNSYGSGMTGPSLVFDSHKNGWNFKIRYFDDCDCLPGIINVRHATKNGEVTQCYCDLLCQNTGKVDLKNFLTLLECKDFDEYVFRRYNKYLELFKQLEKTFEVEDFFTPYLNNKSLLLHNYHSEVYRYVRITSPFGRFILLPMIDENGGDDYQLFIFRQPPPIKSPGQDDYLRNTTIQIFDYISNDHNISVSNIINKYNSPIFEYGFYNSKHYMIDYQSMSHDEVLKAINLL